MLELDTCYISETGGRPRNEDACGYWQSDATGCWVLSDGAGGHGSGDLASRLVVSTVLRRFKELPEVSCQHALSLLKAANDAVIAEKTSGSTRDDMHATAALLLLDRSCERAVLAHVGDSRIYHFRRAGLLSRTCDHSLVQQMVDAGYGNAELLRTHPKRNLLTSAIGAAGAIEMTVSPHPIEVSPGDCLLLCSDGWWEYLQDAEMELALSRTKAGVDWLDEMATTIRRRGKAGHDNYSALCVSVRDELTVLLDPAKVMTLPFQPRE